MSVWGVVDEIAKISGVFHNTNGNGRLSNSEIKETETGESAEKYS